MLYLIISIVGEKRSNAPMSFIIPAGASNSIAIMSENIATMLIQKLHLRSLLCRIGDSVIFNRPTLHIV